METRKIDLSQLIAALKESIAAGKSQYLVLFVGAFISLVVQTVLNMSTFGSLLYFIFISIWTAGVASVSQTITDLKNAPKVSQFFIGFYKMPILKKLVPGIVASGIFNAIILAIMGTVSVFLMIFMQKLSPEQMTNFVSFYGFFTIIFMIVVFILNLPFAFLPMILIFQNLHWKEALHISIQACKKNIFVLVWLLVPAVIPLFVTGVFILLVPFLPSSTLASGSMKEVSQGIGNVLKVVLLFISPFITTINYIVYKKIIAFSQQDAVVE